VTILNEADNIAGEDRSRDYGHPLINHQRIAGIWNILLGDTLKSPITPRQAALMMIGVKLAREINAQKRDNLLDIAGYVKVIDLIDGQPEEKRGRKRKLSDKNIDLIRASICSTTYLAKKHGISVATVRKYRK
jgi:hypothetical protein